MNLRFNRVKALQIKTATNAITYFWMNQPSRPLFLLLDSLFLATRYQACQFTLSPFMLKDKTAYSSILYAFFQFFCVKAAFTLPEPQKPPGSVFLDGRNGFVILRIIFFFQLSHQISSLSAKELAGAFADENVDPVLHGTP